MIGSASPRTAKPGCANCIMRGLGLCSLLLDQGLEQPQAGAHAAITQARRPFEARELLFHQHESLDSLPVICDGWAASALRLSDGRRQILSFLLPGEMITSGLLFEQHLHFSIDAITPGCYRSFDRAQLRAAMFASPTMFDKIALAYNEEKHRADQLITDLGRRTSTERISRLLLDCWDRLEKLGLVEGNSAEFPLRQIHIADATGLTVAHVNKIIGQLREGGLIEISDRALQINDIAKLRRLTI